MEDRIGAAAAYIVCPVLTDALNTLSNMTVKLSEKSDM